jgi:hypothetical protein
MRFRAPYSVPTISSAITARHDGGNHAFSPQVDDIHHVTVRLAVVLATLSLRSVGSTWRESRAHYALLTKSTLDCSLQWS